MALIPITTACNQRCLFCSAHGRGDSPSPAGVLREIGRLAASGAEGVILSGGETTFSKDLARIVAAARGKGLKVELQTNALTSSYPRKAAWLAGLGVDLFNVNFPSNLGSINDRITGTKGTLPLRLAGVRNLIKSGARVRLTHLISGINYRKMPEFVAYVGKNIPGINYIQFSFIKAMGLAAKNAWLVPEYGRVSPYLIKSLALCRKLGIEAVVDHIPPCFMGVFYAGHIDWIKEVNGWDTSLSRSEKKRLPACAACVMKKRCFGPRLDHLVILKGKEMVRPVKTMKELKTGRT